MTEAQRWKEYFVEACRHRDEARETLLMLREQQREIIAAAEQADWQQVVLNGGPPCFHIEDNGRFCLRAQRWDGHDSMHKFTTLDAAIAHAAPPREAAQYSRSSGSVFLDEPQRPLPPQVGVSGSPPLEQARPRDRYRCTACGCFWRLNPPSEAQPDGSWSLYDAHQKPCKRCDNSPEFLSLLDPPPPPIEQARPAEGEVDPRGPLL
jgi:hypothetical protein